MLSALENVEMPLLVSGFDEKESRAKATEALGLVGLSERANHYPSELSGGQQQRVTIARALVNQPEIVWADEPTGNLDSENAQEVMELLIRLNRELNNTFVIITHSDAVAEMSHRTVRMMDGLIVDDGTGRRPAPMDELFGAPIASVAGALWPSPGLPSFRQNPQPNTGADGHPERNPQAGPEPPDHHGPHAGDSHHRQRLHHRRFRLLQHQERCHGIAPLR